MLVKCRPSACEAVRALEAGIRALVSGAADGLDASAVSVVIAPSAETRAPPVPAPSRRSPLLLALAATAGLGAIAFAGAGIRGAFRRGDAA